MLGMDFSTILLQSCYRHNTCQCEHSSKHRIRCEPWGSTFKLMALQNEVSGVQGKARSLVLAYVDELLMSCEDTALLTKWSSCSEPS